jgi:anaerobic ribonucleoside-triphosphate reductase activating protein
MNIAHIEKSANIYGPGERFVIWMQGCSIKCQGCQNQNMLPFEPKNLTTPDKLISQIESSKPDGVTILGGEPFDQFEEIKELCTLLHEKDISIILFSGYSLNYIQQTQFKTILSFIDVLIPEPYKKNMRNTSSGIYGSDNQKLIFLSDRYNKTDFQTQNFAEIILEPDGSMKIYGFPPDSII